MTGTWTWLYEVTNPHKTRNWLCSCLLHRGVSWSLSAHCFDFQPAASLLCVILTVYILISSSSMQLLATTKQFLKVTAKWILLKAKLVHNWRTWSMKERACWIYVIRSLAPPTISNLPTMSNPAAFTGAWKWEDGTLDCSSSPGSCTRSRTEKETIWCS